MRPTSVYIAVHMHADAVRIIGLYADCISARSATEQAAEQTPGEQYGVIAMMSDQETRRMFSLGYSATAGAGTLGSKMSYPWVHGRPITLTTDALNLTSGTR